MTFHEYLSYFGWSQAQLGRYIEVSSETVSRWKGKPPRVVMLYLGAMHRQQEFARNLTDWIEQMRTK